MSAKWLLEAAGAAWREYRDGPMLSWPRRQIRKREFVAGFIAGAELMAEKAAKIADYQGHQWSGAPCVAMFGIADAIRSLSTGSES